jgi:hypothetical protein
VSGARKILIIGGVALAVFGMLYGLRYALFGEHQTLDGMGISLTNAFVSGAERNLADAHAAIDAYSRTKYQYVRQVDVHSHWIGLAMLMIVLGVAFDFVAFSAQIRLVIAIALLTGSVVFPLGVLLQIFTHGGTVANVLAIAGSGLVIASLALTAVGFARQSG